MSDYDKITALEMTVGEQTIWAITCANDIADSMEILNAVIHSNGVILALRASKEGLLKAFEGNELNQGFVKQMIKGELK